MGTIRVSAAVIMEGNRILAAERGYGEYRGFWEFPGGKREEGESGEDAIIREIREELSAAIAVDRLLCIVEHQYDDFFLIMDCYLAHIEGGMIEAREHMALRWLDVDKLSSVRWLPADLKVLPSVRELLSENTTL